MSSHTWFPDAIVFPDGTIRLVSVDAKSWAYSNTDIKRNCTISTVPDYDAFEDSVPQLMSEDGLVVKYERQPVFNYRSKRRRWPKFATSGDGKVIDLFLHIPKHRRQEVMIRAYARHRARNWRLMQEAADKRKPQEVLQDEQSVE
jgi:hypothetical protein